MPSGENDPAEERDAAGDEAVFPIVGVGASAGGLGAFTQLLQALPADTGMAFVLVQHLAPSHPSALAEILGRATTMPVTEVHDEPTVEPNHVYVIPPNRSIIIARGTLQLLPREGRGVHRPVDQFFRSLAEEHRHRAIGGVLSGTASDGTLGLEAIKGEGGHHLRAGRHGSGQEAYSLAMAFTEAAEAAGSSVPLQVFATDLNSAVIDKARAGIYPKDIAQDVSLERLRRFFNEVDGSYRITSRSATPAFSPDTTCWTTRPSRASTSSPAAMC